MGLKIALVGNPNCGKTTLFNALTGANQFVGNWPGVTVEKKEGRLKGYKDTIITDLPGIYSLSPYTLEEVVARNYLIQERPDAVVNIIDGTNPERNLYLTTQLVELGIPMAVAVNMMDVVEKNGDNIDINVLSKELGCKVVKISALKGKGIEEAAQAAVDAADSHQKIQTGHIFSETVENSLENIQKVCGELIPKHQQRWYEVKLFERDEDVMRQLGIDGQTKARIEAEISAAEAEMDDDAESIITNERYEYISQVIKNCYEKKTSVKYTFSDKVDRIVTNRWLGLPIFAVIMFLVYYISMVAVGTPMTDWVNDGVFGDGWYLAGVGSSDFEAAQENYGDADAVIKAFNEQYGNDEIAEAIEIRSDDFSEADAQLALDKLVSDTPADASVEYTVQDEETLETANRGAEKADLENAVAQFIDKDYKPDYGAPDMAAYGIFVPSLPELVQRGLDKLSTADWAKGLILDGIISGVGAVLGFVPQMLVLFLLLAFLEACGYMARIAFVLDRVFRKFGLSGKSFIPMLVAVGCGVPGVMASRTIENERDRRMTIITTTFIPCGAKMPFIAMIAGALFGGSALVSTSAYFIGMAAIIISGIMLKKTRMFAGEPAAFVMELPAYRLPTAGNVLRSMWERSWSFIKKAATVILLSTIAVWFTSRFGFVEGSFTMLEEDQLDRSVLANIGKGIAWIFAPLGWGNWQAAVASITGLVAKENIVSTMGILYGGSGATVWQAIAASFTSITGFSFLVFNLLCAPCFAAIGAIKREMNNARWTWFAIGYQCGFAYVIALMIHQFGNVFLSGAKVNIIGLIAASLLLIGMIFMLVRPYKETAIQKIKNKRLSLGVK